MTDETRIQDVGEENVEDLCRICVPPEKTDDLDWMKGVQEKKRWASDMLQRWGCFAKVAYQNGTPVGLIQYRPVPEEQTVRIDCVYVPLEKGAAKGTASRLLSSLIEDVKRPMSWFDNRQPLALVTSTFDGGEPGQLTAREFFKKKGFTQIGEDPDHLYYPLKTDFVYRPLRKEEPGYIPQDEDRGKVLLVCGPNGCPVTYPFFLKRMERYIREISPDIAIRWVDSADEPDEIRARNIDVGACVVNARLITAFVLDKEAFQAEVKAALGDD